MKKLFIYPILFFLIPISLYINFFIFKLTLWSYEVKAWVIYSIIIITIDIFIIFIVKKLQNLTFKKFNLINHMYLKDFIDGSSYMFLMGNIFLSFPTFRLIIWYTLPLFKLLLMALFSIYFFNKYLVLKNSKLSLSENLFTIKKIKNNKKETKLLYIAVIITVLAYLLLLIILHFILKESYDPLKKSMEYFMGNYNLKVLTLF